MKKKFIKALSLLTVAAAFNAASANTNSGYTTAANVYSGSSSHSWFGGGVEHVLAQWRMEKDVPAEKEAVPESTDATNTDAPSTDAPSMEDQPEPEASPAAKPKPAAATNEASTIKIEPEAAPAAKPKPAAATNEASPIKTQPEAAPVAKPKPLATTNEASTPESPTPPSINE